VNLGRVGIWSQGLREAGLAGTVAEAAADLERLGYSALWIPGGGGSDVLRAVEATLDATESVPVATGILNLWMHEPADVVAEFRRIEERHPGRLLLGIGVSHAPMIDRVEGKHYDRPLATTREYLDSIGDAIPADRMMLAALGPKMLQLARDRTAGSHSYLAPVEHTRVAREALGPDKHLAPELTVLLEDDSHDARDEARAFLELYLGLPNYTNNWLRHGFHEHDLRDGGSDRLVDGLIAWGGPERIAERVREHLDAGADHVCIQVIGGDRSRLKADEWRALAPALTQ
jgi:probable F420-dependent oxidoreductase